MIGKNLSHYKILEELGRGGMGIVYKAEDTKLDRTVAIKVLPPHALSDEDKARFYREAKAAAQLHHPHIASIFEIDEAVPSDSPHGVSPSPFISMEYVDGMTLGERIAEGPLKLEEAVRIASEVAEGLKVAHAKNIVHRDIKSGNVMLDAEGGAKVLDFGLAQTSQSTKLTQMGSTLGTVAYMSPEQARGETVDYRSDLWSLGVVIYEMIAAKHPFPGNYEQALIYGILNEDPEPLTAVRTGVPMGLEWIVTKLLAKNPNDRYQSASELIVDLRNVKLDSKTMSRVSPSSPSGTGAQTSTPPSSSRDYVKYGIGLAVGATLVALAWLLLPNDRPPESSGPVMRLSRTIPTSTTPTNLDISDDGTKVAYILDLVYVLDLQTGESRALEGTENTTVVEFSSDGEWLLLTKTRSIDRIPVSGGTPLEVVRSNEAAPRAAWGPDDWIIYEDEQEIFKYSESKTERVQISHKDSLAGEIDFDWPTLLPDGETVMATLESTGQPARIRFWDFKSGAVLGTVKFAGYRVQFLPSGHLAAAIGEDGLVVVPFDINRLEMTGPRIPVVSGVEASLVSISGNGTIVYAAQEFSLIPRSVPAILQFPEYRERLDMEAGYYSDVEISPDGNKAVLVRHGGDANRILRSLWVVDMKTRESRRISNFTLLNYPTWMPGSDSIAFIQSEFPGSAHSVYVRSSDGSGDEILLMPGVSRIGGIDISPDGNTLLYVAAMSPQAGLLRKFNRRTGERVTISDPGGTVSIRNPRISPDGRYVGYERDDIVFVTALDGSGIPTNITKGFGAFPTWTRNGTELFWTTFGGSILHANTSLQPIFSTIGQAQEAGIMGSVVPYFDVFNDGERAIVADLVEDPFAADSSNAANVQLNFVINWFEELKERASGTHE